MSEAYGLSINPTDPSTYDLVMDIVQPHQLQGEVATKASPSWHFGGWGGNCSE